MASSKAAQLIPSTGVLIGALGAALAAAILVNVYVGYAKSEYEEGSKTFLQLQEDVERNTPLQDRHMKAVRIPKPLLPAFERAVKADEKESLVVGKKAPRRLTRGQFLFYSDFLREAGDESTINPPKGMELISIPISPDAAFGRQLQPGAYVTLFGDFDISPDPKKAEIRVLEVMKNVQVRSLGGDPNVVVSEKARSYDSIQLIVKQSQAPQLLQIKNLLRSKRFTITVSHSPQGSETAEPEITRDVLSLLDKTKPIVIESGTLPTN